MFNPNSWTFLTNHSHVLLCLVQNPSMRMRDIAIKVGITERAVQHIIAELSAECYITRSKKGRCNTYQINTDRHLRHPIEAKQTIRELIDLIILRNTGVIDSA
ncbi:MAG: ArsR family transcriptional regulator [Candidatus Riflebacteria bacterium HGW-Riflebacteria-1]|nr:MAG: ArsR family transcriptional regulator [Candidatus Riflebacteria bacterium HGW-Riflebacteria-1]